VTATTDLILAPITTPSTAIIVSAQLQRDVATIEDRLGSAAAITDQASMDLVRAITADAQALLRQVETQRKIAQAPFSAVVDKIMAAAKPITMRLEEVKAEGKLQMAEAVAARDRQLAAEEAARRAVEQAELAKRAAEAAAAAQAGLPTAPARPTPALVPMSITPALEAPLTARKEVQFLDLSLIPREWLVPDYPRIRAAVLAGAVIPGVVLATVRGIAAR
jgi:hypothetical protein